jgi:hypothetical protein
MYLLFHHLCYLHLQEDMVQFRFKQAVVLLLWKSNIADFTVDVLENSDPRYPNNCMLVTDNNDDECKVKQIAERCRSNNDSNEALKQSYTTLIGVINLMCPDELFEGICNYL